MTEYLPYFGYNFEFIAFNLKTYQKNQKKKLSILIDYIQHGGKNESS